MPDGFDPYAVLGVTPCATPAASFIKRATSSKNRFVVCTILASTACGCTRAPRARLAMGKDNGNGASAPQGVPLQRCRTNCGAMNAMRV